MHELALNLLADQIRQWAAALGFVRVGIADVELAAAERRLRRWLERGLHGGMTWMAAHGAKRARPWELVPGTCRVITVSMDYLPEPMERAQSVLDNPALGYVSRYALGRDYHKLIRKRLQQLAEQIAGCAGDFGYRVFCDSAPVMEKALAAKSGQGWVGKHSNVLNRDRGSWFFLGEMYTDLPLPTDRPVTAHCGSCTACLDICPTAAIIEPCVVDARKCISYLTIEHRGSIPVQHRKAIGNRIYGCDDCQLVCPWNRYAKLAAAPDFQARHGLDAPDLAALFAWDEPTFLTNTEGSAIRRLGHRRWLRNIAVALGNLLGALPRGSPAAERPRAALQARLSHPEAMVREHTVWALAQCPDP